MGDYGRDIEEKQKKEFESVKQSYQKEMNMFIHAHLRGYDQQGEGRYEDHHYVDRYGAPIQYEESWSEGYRSIDDALLKHNEHCSNEYINFPTVGGYCGGAHLYKNLHKDNPQNWTGWISKQKTHRYNLTDGSIPYMNRFFVSLRGNEIQNDLWDYNPLTVIDSDLKGNYLGGYWYEDDIDHRVNSRYLHIVALKTVNDPPERFNYIVHPLAYRPALNEYPDCGVDGIQWSINNIANEKHITTKNWGGKCHGIELFNDFTYYYSWIPHYDNTFDNGTVTVSLDEITSNVIPVCICWYDTYPLEYCEFLLDNALSRGVYLYAMSANDAFYNREIDIDNETTEQKHNNILLADPKGARVKETKLTKEQIILRKESAAKFFLLYQRYVGRYGSETTSLINSNNFFNSRPYKLDTVFGYTALLNTNNALYTKMYKDKIPDLNKGEDVITDVLLKGQFFSHTGIYDVFNYDSAIVIPYSFNVQPYQDVLWYNEETKDLKDENNKMIIAFPKADPDIRNSTLIWRYTLEYVDKENQKRVLVTGYFKLDSTKQTILDLSVYTKYDIKWLRFTILDHDNPMRRAWFSPVRGPAFSSKAEWNLENHISKNNLTESENYVTFTDNGDAFQPWVDIKPNNSKLEFVFAEGHEHYLHSYFLQVNALQETIKKPSTERYLQNVHGYLALSEIHPTKLILSTSWDPKTVKDDKVYFYRVNSNTCQPEEPVINESYKIEWI